MFDKVAGLGGFFSQKKIDHPLAEPRELRRVLNELPKDNAFRALEEIATWFESLSGVADFPGDRLFEVAQQLEGTASHQLKRLARDYFQTARLTQAEEQRLWSINHGFWSVLADTYEHCLSKPGEKTRPGDLSKSNLPLLLIRLIVALGHMLKWEQFHYGSSRDALWLRLGGVLLLAEEAGVASKAVALPGKSGMTTPALEYQKVMAFQSASLDSLLPVEIEIAEHLISHFIGSFVFTNQARLDSMYWSDLKLAQPPLRLARMPAKAEATQRFMKPGPAHEAMRDLLASLERGDELPATIDVGGQYPVTLLVKVLRHLTHYFSPTPPQRQHDRHRVMHRMSVLHGLINAVTAFSGESGERPAGVPIESWVAENVSRGGFCAVLSNIPEEWLKVGALLALQPEGGANWLLGVIRRYHREAQNQARAGIQVLATKVIAIELRARLASSYAAAAGIPALMLLDSNEPNEFRVALPPGAFNPREEMEYLRDGRRCVLTPVALIEKTAEYELVRYRQIVLG